MFPCLIDVNKQRRWENGEGERRVCELLSFLGKQEGLWIQFFSYISKQGTGKDAHREKTIFFFTKYLERLSETLFTQLFV